MSSFYRIVLPQSKKFKAYIIFQLIVVLYKNLIIQFYQYQEMQSVKNIFNSEVNIILSAFIRIKDITIWIRDLIIACLSYGCCCCRPLIMVIFNITIWIITSIICQIKKKEKNQDDNLESQRICEDEYQGIIEKRNKQLIVEKNQKTAEYDRIIKKKIQETNNRIKNYVQKAENQFTKKICLEKIQNDGGRNKVIFIGNTGVGKSSLINKLYGLTLKTGKLQTTFGYEKVYTIDERIDIYDSEGYNQDNSDQQLQLWENLNYYKIVFILYQDTLKASKMMIQCLCKPKDRVYKVYFVCTKCDLWDDSNNKTIDEQIQQQRNYLSSIGISNVNEIRFFKSSARKNSFDGGENENYKIANLISEPQ